MEVNKEDRDTLRASQHLLNHQLSIGSIIEHRTQDPKRYKQMSAKPDGKPTETYELPKIEYQNKHFCPNVQPDVDLMDGITDDIDPGLPIPISDVKNNSWVHMNHVEFDKLEWMTEGARKSDIEHSKNSPRFDLEGRVVQAGENTTQKSQEAGMGNCHDIEMLVKLLDSTYDPQVTYALKVVSRIANLATMGYYDASFSENIHGILIKNCLLRVRHQLDNENETLCRAALICLRSLLCNTQVDEVIMDKIYPMISNDCDPNMWLSYPEMVETEFTDEMEDGDCIGIDPIRALIERTNVLERFYYLVQNKVGSTMFTYYDNILEILIRMSRHSLQTCSLLHKHDLLTTLFNIFKTRFTKGENNATRYLCLKTLKLFRIIIQAARRKDDPTVEKLMPVIESYFLIDCYSLPSKGAEQLLKLNIESFRIMKALSLIDVFKVQIFDLFIMNLTKLVENFKALSTLSSTETSDKRLWQYSAHLIDVYGSLLHNRPKTCTKLDEIWWSFIRPAFVKWLTDIIREKTIPHVDVSIALATCVSYHPSSRFDSGPSPVDLLIDEIMKQNSNKRVNFFRVILKDACQKSQLTKFAEGNGNLRDPVGLPSYGHLWYNTSREDCFELNPLFNDSSPFILLDLFIRQLEPKFATRVNDLGVFVNNLEFVRYIKLITVPKTSDHKLRGQIRRSMNAQFELRTISLSLLILSKYYLRYADDDSEGESLDVNFEPSKLKGMRKESYGNICYYIIAVLGLIGRSLGPLKEILLNQVLLTEKLHSRLAEENFKTDTYLERIIFGKVNPINGETLIEQFDVMSARALAPLYESFDLVDCFWIFQPIIDYYFGQIARNDNTKPKDDANWFKNTNNVKWRVHTAESNNCSDPNFFTIILKFNLTMIQCSPLYTNLTIQPNAMDFLCLLGCTFLHDNLFLDEGVAQQLELNLRLMLKDTQPPFGDASAIITPLKIRLADFFDNLVDQYESVSYGERTFSNFLLLFLGMKSDKTFRKKLFQEKADTCLPVLQIAIDDVWVPHTMFFDEKEKDPEIVSLIRRSEPNIKRGSFLQCYREFHIKP